MPKMTLGAEVNRISLTGPRIGALNAPVACVDPQIPNLQTQLKDMLGQRHVESLERPLHCRLIRFQLTTQTRPDPRHFSSAPSNS
ncbi:unnamed protein product [Penicillium roqueforti FM164]|uniref:Genomic scaffold, ProqFM164S03 n=1 Tax=Penicillium roqueforti (strain FM164) TaxID=1365484 RepID=W6QAG2_PENRF|nr:unnamed protein product [Penicillium roqueforti FM164]